MREEYLYVVFEIIKNRNSILSSEFHTNMIAIILDKPVVKHLVGIISDISLTAKEALETRRGHWKIENNLHHVLDDVFREDRSSARKSKNNLALIRKIAYNLIKIACIHDNTGKGTQEMSDMFADDLGLIAKYVFNGIQKVR